MDFRVQLACYWRQQGGAEFRRHLAGLSGEDRAAVLCGMRDEELRIGAYDLADEVGHWLAHDDAPGPGAEDAVD